MKTLIIRKQSLPWLVISIALLLLLVSSPAAVNAAAPKNDASTPAAKPNPMIEKWGIEVTSLRMSANDHMVDFRYRVLDAKKADNLFSKGDKPYLVEQKTGKVLAVPRTAKVGPLMSNYQHKQNRIYWMFFGNRNGLIKTGSKVNVVIGEFKAENLVVE